MRKQPFAFTLLLLCIYLSFSFPPPTTITGSLSIISPPLVTHTYTFGGLTAPTISFVLTVTGMVGKGAIMKVSLSATPPSIQEYSTSYYIHKNPRQTSLIDLESANRRSTQTANLFNVDPNTVITIFILNFQANALSYTLDITQKANPNTCLAPPIDLATYYCSSCSVNYQGVYCNWFNTVMANQQVIYSPLLGSKQSTFTISSGNSVVASISPNSQYLIVCVQYKTRPDQIAGIFNSVDSKSCYKLNNPTAIYTIQIQSNGLDISIAVINTATTPVNFSIWYTQNSSTTNIMVIVLGVLGGILLVIIIIAGCYIAKKMRQNIQIVNPLQSVIINHDNASQNNKLTDIQIEIYFPSVLCRAIFGQEEQSTDNILNRNKQQSTDRDCVICLCPVDLSDIMKVTYCRHMFHATCLLQWFKKQRNCPYCREDYTKAATIEQYQSLLRNSGLSMLGGQDIVKQIFRPKIVSKVKIQVEDIKQQDES